MNGEIGMMKQRHGTKRKKSKQSPPMTEDRKVVWPVVPQMRTHNPGFPGKGQTR